MIIGSEQPDRRSLFRMCIECPVEISGLPDGAEAQGKVIDLSGAGMAIACSESLSLGQRFRVKVVPDKPIFMPLVADVEVVRVEQREGEASVYGVKIGEILS